MFVIVTIIGLTICFNNQVFLYFLFCCLHFLSLLLLLLLLPILLTECSYYVTYAFQSESTLYSCLNFTELLASSKEFLDIQATIECGFTLKRVRDMIRTYSQMYREKRKREK